VVDVVIVPDFDGEASVVFEARTLYFLASWIENAGAASRFPLHVASIGEPPASVRRLAAAAEASLTVHEPLHASAGRFSNKLRGLEIESQTGDILLLDADMLLLADPTGIERLAGSIAAGPTGRPRLTAAEWQRVYEGLGMELPGRSMSSLIGVLAASRAPRKYREIIPEYHAASVLSPAGCGLRDLWEAHCRRTGELFTAQDTHWKTIVRSVEPGLATAIETLRRQGLSFSPLPPRFNTRWHQVLTGSVRWQDSSLLHLEAFPSGLEAATGETAIAAYCAEVRRTYSAPRYPYEELLTYDVEALSEFTARLEERMRALHRRHIAPVISLSA